MSDPIVVFRTSSDIEASVVRGLLDSHGIRTLATSDGPRAIFPLAVSSLGEVHIAVVPDQADEARQVIESYRAQSGPGRVVPFGYEWSALETRLDYRFRDSGLLEQALTHRSRAEEDVTGGVTDNESLEFLGDAVLGFVIADLLYREFPDEDEGHKSKVKASLVSAPSLAHIAERLDLGEALLLGRGEEKTGGRSKRALLANACEALIAALYLDGGIDVARGFILREWDALVARARRPGLLTALTGDYKSALQELLQSQNGPLPGYVLVAEDGPDHDKRFVVEARAGDQVLAQSEGRSKKEAEQRAAKIALAALGVSVDDY